MYPLFSTLFSPLLSNSCVRLGGNGGCLGKSVKAISKQIRISNHNYLNEAAAKTIGYLQAKQYEQLLLCLAKI